VHAHGSRLGAAVAALRRAGLAPTVGAPGLVQANEARGALLREASAHGLRLVTDHGPSPAWPGEGRQVRVEGGLAVMAPTVRPEDWGLFEGEGEQAGLCPEKVDRLHEIEDRAAELGAAYFGLTFHEHDLCPPGSLRPRPGALRALERLFSRGAVPSAEAARVQGAGPRPIPLGDPALWLARALGRGAGWLRGRRWRRSPPRRLDRVYVPVGERGLCASRIGPPRPRAIVLASHAGPHGGRAVGLRPFGLDDDALAEVGVALWLYDRSGTGDSAALGPPGPATPGSPAHVEDWRAMLARAREEGRPVFALSWSSGLLPVLRAAAAGDRPDALLDAEGPSDRFSLVPPPGAGAPLTLAARSPFDDAAWVGLEPVGLLGSLGAPYIRLQGSPDHLHGDWSGHAAALLDAAGRAGLQRPALSGPRPLGELLALVRALSLSV
jgi:hypothetical protein